MANALTECTTKEELFTQEKINQLRWEVLEHPSYSPDLAPSDFHLYGPLNTTLAGVANDAEVECEVKTWFTRKQSTQFYAAGLGGLIKRCDMCTNLGGNYVEK